MQSRTQTVCRPSRDSDVFGLERRQVESRLSTTNNCFRHHLAYNIMSTIFDDDENRLSIDRMHSDL